MFSSTRLLEDASRAGEMPRMSFYGIFISVYDFRFPLQVAKRTCEGSNLDPALRHLPALPLQRIETRTGLSAARKARSTNLFFVTTILWY